MSNKRKRDGSIDAALSLHQAADQAGNAAKVLRDCIQRLKSTSNEKKKKKKVHNAVCKELSTTADVMQEIHKQVESHAKKLSPMTGVAYVAKRVKTQERRELQQQIMLNGGKQTEKTEHLLSMERYKAAAEKKEALRPRRKSRPKKPKPPPPPPAPKDPPPANGTQYTIQEACSILSHITNRNERAQRIAKWVDKKLIPVGRVQMYGYLKRYTKEGTDFSHRQWGQRGRPTTLGSASVTLQLEKMAQRMNQEGITVDQRSVDTAIMHLQRVQQKSAGGSTTTR